jgi:hypothetical protein
MDFIGVTTFGWKLKNPAKILFDQYVNLRLLEFPVWFRYWSISTPLLFLFVCKMYCNKAGRFVTNARSAIVNQFLSIRT